MSRGTPRPLTNETTKLRQTHRRRVPTFGLGRLCLACALATSLTATAEAATDVYGYFTSFQSPITVAPDNPLNASFNLIGTNHEWDPETGTLLSTDVLIPLQAAPPPNPPRPTTDYAAGGFLGAQTYVQSSPVILNPELSVGPLRFGLRGNFMTPGENSIDLLGFGFPQETINPGEVFPLVDIVFTNGDWAGEATIGIRLEIRSSDPRFNGIVLNETLKLGVTTVGADATAEQGADFLYIADRPDLGSMRVYESVNSLNAPNVAAFTLWGYFDEQAGAANSMQYATDASVTAPSLRLWGFDVDYYPFPGIGGFWDPSISTGYTPPVPEPGAAWMLLAGLAGLTLRGRKSGSAAKVCEG